MFIVILCAVSLLVCWEVLKHYFHIQSLIFFQDLEKKILIVQEAEDEILRKTWTEMKPLEGIQVATCHCTDLISICTKETFLLIFLDMSSVAGNAQKICSTIRWVHDKINFSNCFISTVSFERVVLLYTRTKRIVSNHSAIYKCNTTYAKLINWRWLTTF